MKTILVRFTLFIFIAAFVISCQKETSIDLSSGSSGGANALLGNWKFAGFTAAIKVEATETDGIDIAKTVNTANYISTNNKGTVTFAEANFTGTNLSYDLNTTLYVKIYLNGALEDSLDFPFNFTLPPTNSAGTYKLVGQDSLYFTGGFIAVGLDSMESKPIGYKYSITGNKLTLTTKYFNTFKEDDNGVIADIKQNADIKVVLEK